MLTLRIELNTQETLYYETLECNLIELIDMILTDYNNLLLKECANNLKSLRYDYLNKVW